MVNEFVLYRWARNVVNGHPHKAGSFVTSFAETFLKADHENVAIMLPAAERVWEKYPAWDVEEPEGKHAGRTDS